MADFPIQTPDDQHSGHELDRQTARAAVAAVKPKSIAHASVTTSAAGANWVTLGAAACDVVTIVNQSGADVEVRRGGGGVGIQVPDGTGYGFGAIANANELSVRRVDQSNTQATIQYERVEL